MRRLAFALTALAALAFVGSMAIADSPGYATARPSVTLVAYPGHYYAHHAACYRGYRAYGRPWVGRYGNGYYPGDYGRYYSYRTPYYYGYGYPYGYSYGYGCPYGSYGVSPYHGWGLTYGF
jgi:hypothetical protein